MVGNTLSSQVRLALRSLLRNRVQTGLAILGMMVGVAALVTSMALGRGAQDALEQQLRAAGANLLMVTAGNYDVRSGPAIGEGEATNHDAPSVGDSETTPETEAGAAEDIDPAAYSTAWRRPGIRGFGSDERFGTADNAWDGYSARLAHADYRPVASENLFTRVHWENDPFAVHDHPTAAERLGDSMAGLGSAATLTREDAAAIAQIEGVQYVVSGVHENARLYLPDGETAWFTRLHGTEANLPQLRTGWTISHGRFLDGEDVAEGQQVAVLGKVVADRLFGEGVNPVGETVVLWNQDFEVIGVVSSSSWAVQPAPGDDQFDAFYIPISTVHTLLNLNQLNTIAVTTNSADLIAPVGKKVTELLRERHEIGESDPDDFKVQSVAEQVLGEGIAPSVARVVSGNMGQVEQMTVANLSASLKRTNRTIYLLLASVAAVSLLVGGIGVMNLLLLAVTQRTREVGLRMALGARPADISRQFLLEAILLSLIGGVLGIAVGVAASGTMEQFFEWSAAISPLAAAIAVTVAIIIGAIFGVYPARRAARLNPIEALHYD